MRRRTGGFSLTHRSVLAEHVTLEDTNDEAQSSAREAQPEPDQPREPPGARHKRPKRDARDQERNGGPGQPSSFRRWRTSYGAS
jgi:hypothetical protein